MSHPTGFEFPGTFELTAFVVAAEAPPETVIAELGQAGVQPDPDSVSLRPSREGRFVAVRVAFYCESRELMNAAHARLRAHPAIKWTL